MSVTTKKGDKGETSLIGGQRVLKCDDRVEAYGSVDELSAFIGVLYDSLPAEDKTRDFLMQIQRNLFTIEAVFACPGEPTFPRLSERALTELETEIKAIERELPPLREWVIPGGNMPASHCHVCRTICRRAERQAVKIGADGVELAYLNRLSDYFFELARRLSLV